MTPEIFYDAAFVGVTGDELVFLYAGSERRVRTFPQGPTEKPRHPPGTRGVVVILPDEPRFAPGDGTLRRPVGNPAARYRFEAYVDQSLVRAPELDIHERFDPIRPRSAELGWRNDFYPDGFRAPAGIIPGENGAYEDDCTALLEIAVPPEFDDLCKRFKSRADHVLRAFIADAAQLMNFFSCPRADGYSSNGSDERRLALEYLQRTFGPPEE